MFQSLLDFLCVKGPLRVNYQQHKDPVNLSGAYTLNHSRQKKDVR